MLRLLLVRHAKAIATAPGLRDRDRPLNERGRSAAAELGRGLAARALCPELILCSDAERARQTMEIMVGCWAREPQTRILPELYDQVDADYVGLVHAESGGAVSVMVVAHNPAIHATALALADGTQPGAGELRRHYPTAAVAVLDFDADGWPAVALGRGQLAAFIVPDE
jgi:phosphohistidine phosphatase